MEQLRPRFMTCADALEGALADPTRRAVRIVTDDTCADACVTLARKLVRHRLHGRRGYLSQVPGAGDAPWAARALELLAWHGAHRGAEPTLAPVDVSAAEAARRGGVAGFARVMAALDAPARTPPIVVLAPIRTIEPALRSEIDELVTASLQRTRTQIVLVERVLEGAAVDAMRSPLALIDARAPSGTAVGVLGEQLARTADALEHGPSRRTTGGAGPASGPRARAVRPLGDVAAHISFALGDEGRAVMAESVRAMGECVRGDPAAALRRQVGVVARCLAAGAIGEAASQQLHAVAFAAAAGMPAVEHARGAVDLADRSEEPRHAVTSRLALAAIVRARGEEVEASRWYREAAERAVAISEPILAIEGHRCAGELALQHGLARVGIEQLERAVALATTIEPEARCVSGAIDAAQRLADALARAGLHERARACRATVDQWASPRRTA